MWALLFRGHREEVERLVLLPAVLLPCCVTCDKFHPLSKPWFPQLSNGSDSSSPYPHYKACCKTK